VVRQIFDWVGRDRLSIGEVCRRLLRQECPTRSGKRVWDRSTVWAILRNPAYRGRLASVRVCTRINPLLRLGLGDEPA
jgi:site-specific DNA recombinase